MKSVKTLVALTAAAALSVGAASAMPTVNIAVNGDFETGDLSGWSSFDAAKFTSESTTPQEGSFNGKLAQLTPTTAAITKQANLGAGTLTPEQDVTITFWARGSTAAGGVQFAEFFSEKDGGGTSKTEILGGAPLFALSPTDWTFYSFDTTLGTAANGGVGGGVTLQFAAVTGGDSGSTSILEIDDVQVLVPVPEPGSLALLGLGGLALVRRRRA